MGDCFQFYQSLNLEFDSDSDYGSHFCFAPVGFHYSFHFGFGSDFDFRFGFGSDSDFGSVDSGFGFDSGFGSGFEVVQK
jgi:hypothetical protein